MQQKKVFPMTALPIPKLPNKLPLLPSSCGDHSGMFWMLVLPLPGGQFALRILGRWGVVPICTGATPPPQILHTFLF